MMGVAPSRQEKERKKLLRHGVLVPPMFGVGSDVIPPPSSRTHRGSVAESVMWLHTAACVEDGVGERLLSDEHMKPGVWVSASTPSLDGSVTTFYSLDGSNKKGDSSASGILGAKLFSPTNDANGTLLGLSIGALSSPSSPAYDAKVSAFVARPLARWGTISFHGAADNRTNKHTSDHSNSKDVTDCDSSAGNWTLGWNYNATLPLHHYSTSCRQQPQKAHDIPDHRNAPQSSSSVPPSELWALFRMGSNSRWSSNHRTLTGVSSHASCTIPRFGMDASLIMDLPVNHEFDSLHLTKSDLQDSTQLASLCYDSCRSLLRRSSWSHRLSFDLNALSSEKENPSSPPIYVTWNRRPTSSAVSVSQIIPFHRLVVNPIEERCFKIRNTISWAVRIHDNQAVEGAIAWQVNRGLCYKLQIANNNNNNSHKKVTLGILLKRWADPRVTASLLFSPFGNTNGGTFHGVGIQIETGPLPGGDGKVRYPLGAATYDDMARDLLYGTRVFQEPMTSSAPTRKELFSPRSPPTTDGR